MFSLRKKVLTVSFALVACAYLGGCSQSTPSSTPSSSVTTQDGDPHKHLSIFATTGYIGDAVKNIAPDAEVTVMIGPGADPHTYQATTADFSKMDKADAIIWNGLTLEAQIQSQLSKYGEKQFAVGDSIDKKDLLPWVEEDHDEHEHADGDHDEDEEHGEADHDEHEEHANEDHDEHSDGNHDEHEEGHHHHHHGAYDPHIWNSPMVWSIAVNKIGDYLGKIDPANAETYKKNASEYVNKIDEVAKKAQQDLSSVTNRILVTGHDAFNYLGQYFNLEVKATDLVSTDAEQSASEINEIADYIVQHKVNTIFFDNTQNPQAIVAIQEAVKAKGGDVKISDQKLYAGTLGTTAPVDTYLGVLEHNTKAIAEGLSN